MTIGAQVMFPPALGAVIGDQATPIGIVAAEGAGTADVMWEDTGALQTGILQTALRTIRQGPGYMVLRIGEWVDLGTYPQGQGGPKSPGAGGLLMETFMLSPYDAPTDETIAYARISVNNGLGSLLIAENPGAEGSSAQQPPANTMLLDRPGRRNS